MISPVAMSPTVHRGKRCTEDFGRFFGSGAIRPAVCRIRRIVEVDGPEELVDPASADSIEAGRVVMAQDEPVTFPDRFRLAPNA